MDFKAVQRIKPSEQEIANNPRARSAILRVAERLPTAQHEVLV
jgi:16S rRNA (cytosine1402-N4)-methyltransferase